MSLRFPTLVKLLLAAGILLAASSTLAFGQVVFYNIDQMPGWENCGACAGRGGNGPVVPYSTTQFRQWPSLDGASQEFWLGGSTPYSSALWWKQLTPLPWTRNFIYDFWVYTANPNAAQAFEFDVNQSVDGKKFIFGTECDFNGSHQWDVWDDWNNRWTPTGVGCVRFPANGWVHMGLFFQRTWNDQVYYVGVSINNQMYYFNRTFTPHAANANELNVAVQLDGNYREENYSIWLDQAKLTAW